MPALMLTQIVAGSSTGRETWGHRGTCL